MIVIRGLLQGPRLHWAPVTQCPCGYACENPTSCFHLSLSHPDAEQHSCIRTPKVSVRLSKVMTKLSVHKTPACPEGAWPSDWCPIIGSPSPQKSLPGRQFTGKKIVGRGETFLGLGRSYNGETFYRTGDILIWGDISDPWLSLPGRIFHGEDILTWHRHATWRVWRQSLATHYDVEVPPNPAAPPPRRIAIATSFNT